LGEDKKSCFLCAPDADLIYAQTADWFALCGLGPLLPGYSLVTTRQHIPSAADAINVVTGFVNFAEQVRRALAEQYGNCVLTEHGRVPVCFDPSGTSDPHCYHAHFLLFPGAPDVSQAARRYFAVVQSFSDLQDALEGAAPHKDYFLVSPNSKEVHVMARPGRIIRQFARMLVADAIGEGKRANWRKFPERDRCVTSASGLRKLFDRGTAA